MTGCAADSVAAPAAAATVDARPILLVNRGSHAARSGLAGPATALARDAGAEVRHIDTLPAMQAAVRDIVARRRQHVIVLAGDGSIHAVVDQLAAAPWRPSLLLLPGGRSNLTAADIDPRAALPLLRAALTRVAAAGSWDAALVERTLLRVQQPGAPARHGFFVAAAQLDAFIRRVHAWRAGGSGVLRRGALSAPWVLLLHAMRRLPALPCPRLQLDAGALGRIDGPTRLLLATTLHHASGALAPYARRGSGPLQLTAVLRDGTRFWRRLPRLVSGRHSTAMAAPGSGIVSGRCERFRVTGVAGYMLDGEPFDADPALPLVAGAGPVLRFVRP